jgi:N-acylneuraminate cytidylyltransferase
MTDSNVFFLIPARGGSKGIPRKNLREVGGVPLVARSIAAAQEANVSDAIFVSTDDSEIAALALSCGAGVIERPAELSLDASSSEDAISHFLDITKTETGTLIMIQPTSAFVTGEDLRALASICQSFDSALTVTSSHSFLWRSARDGSLTSVNHDSSTRLRRQDLANNEFVENGAAYGMSVDGFRRYRHRFFGRIGFVEMPRIRSFEIDSPEDLDLAKLISALIKA